MAKLFCFVKKYLICPSAASLNSVVPFGKVASSKIIHSYPCDLMGLEGWVTVDFSNSQEV